MASYTAQHDKHPELHSNAIVNPETIVNFLYLQLKTSCVILHRPLLEIEFKASWSNIFRLDGARGIDSAGR